MKCNVFNDINGFKPNKSKHRSGEFRKMNENQNQTESLLEIIKGIKDQIIMLPEFQRDFRWDLTQTYDLFDSLIKDIFIGTIIYGKPAFTMTLREIDTRPRKGKGSNSLLTTHDFTKEQLVKLAHTKNLRIVLDGQQRITSIYRAVIGIDNVYFILRDDLNSESIPTLTLEDGLDDDDLGELFAKTTFGKTLPKEANENRWKVAKKLHRRAIYQLIDLYKQQKLVAFYLLDMSLSKFCIFFERSNSRSIQLSFTDILAAKLYHGFNLRKKIEEFESENKNLFKLNREVIVRTIAYIVGAKKGTIDIDRNFILEHLDAQDFKDHWESTCKLYTDCLTYLTNQHYILSQSWMPSENMLIPLMIFLRQIRSFAKMSHEQRTFLEYWYWSSIFANRYSSSSNETIITDCGVLVQVAQDERISTRNYFIRMRSLVTEPDDLFSYTKKTSIIYRGILNLLGYASQGLKDWNNTQKIDVSMTLEDHHIYPRAYIASKPKLMGLDQNEAEQLVDCVVNRTLIPKGLNVLIGKKAPADYLSELQITNLKLADCLPSHFIPVEMISDITWNSHFKLFLEERAERIFDLIYHYTNELAAEVIPTYNTPESDNRSSIHVPFKPRLKDLLAEGKIKLGEQVFVRKFPDKTATIVDGDTVEYNGKKISINAWGQLITGWTSINIYSHVNLKRTGQSIDKLRNQSEVEV